MLINPENHTRHHIFSYFQTESGNDFQLSPTKLVQKINLNSYK